MGDVHNIFKNTFKGMENGNYNYCQDGKCTGCGKCCSNLLPLSFDEVEQIKKYVKKNNIKKVSHLIPINSGSFDLNCPFMENTGNKRCRIYSVRPRVCRDFICDPAQRKIPSASQKYFPVIMSETFFEK